MTENAAWETSPVSPAARRQMSPRLWCVLAAAVFIASFALYRYREATPISSVLGELSGAFRGNPSIQVLRSRRATLDERVVAAENLRMLGPDSEVRPQVNALIQALNTGDPPLRAAAALSLGSLIYQLNQPPDPKRVLPATARECRESAIAALINKLDDPDQNALLAVCSSFNQVYRTPQRSSEQPPPPLVANLDHNWPPIRLAVCQALVQFPGYLTSLIPRLMTMLEDPEPTTRAAASQALSAATPDRTSIPVLLDGLRSENRLEQFHAARLLGQLGPDSKAAVPDLIARLKRPVEPPPPKPTGWNRLLPVYDVEQEASVALARIAPGESTTKLYIAMLEAGDPAVPGTAERWAHAAVALRACGQSARAADSALCTCLSRLLDSKTSMFESILPLVEAIGQLAPGTASADRAVGLLSRAISLTPEAANAPVRTSAARALGNFGRAAEPAIPQLKLVASEPLGQARRFAAQSISAIEKAARPKSSPE